MENIEIDNIKYYPDRFYIRLDGFDIEHLTDFITNMNLGEQHAIFIHEYYHYLTNIVTYAGVRQFHLNFCDRFRLVTILAYKKGLDAFPLKDNDMLECKEEIDYWNNVTRIIDQDDLDYELAKEINQSPGRRFEIVSIVKEKTPETFIVAGQKYEGIRIRVNIEIDGLINRDSFELTYGALDEFLSSSIDEYLFEHDLADVDPQLLSRRPYYPYRFFDDLLKFYNIRPQSAFEKILLAYYALNSQNPPLALIELFEGMAEGGYALFQENPEAYLLQRNRLPDIDKVLTGVAAFSEQCFNQGRIHMAQALRYYQDRFYIAHQLMDQDFFFFLRPFFVQHEDVSGFKQQFLLALARIIQVFTPPVILKDGVFHYIDKLTTMGEATTHIIATYEIFESIKKHQIARRPNYLKKKYRFPENDPDCDDIQKFTLPPIMGSYRLALNEIGLYPLYLYKAHPELKNVPKK